MASSDLVNYVNSDNGVLDTDNYTETDALIFAELSYMKFEDVLPNANTSDAAYSSGDASYPVNEYAQQMLNAYKSATDADHKLTDDQIELLTAIAKDDRYSNCTIHDLACADKNDSQWAAYTVDIGNDTSVIAMRGTDGTTMGWKEDLELVYDTDGTNAQNYSRDYLESCNAENIYMTGHSKGGSDVTSAYVLANEETRNKVVQVDNFDGPGMNDEMIASHQEAYNELGSKLDNYYPENSVVGLLLNNNPGENHFVDANVRKNYWSKLMLGEHDPFAFQVEGNGFKIVGQTRFSKLVDNMLDETVKDLSYEERERLANTLEMLGIPSLIAENPEELSYYVSEEEANAILNSKLGIFNGLSDTLDGPAAKVLTFCAGIELYKNLPEKDKETLSKVGKLCIAHGFDYLKQMVGDDINNLKLEFFNFMDEKTNILFCKCDSIKSIFGKKWSSLCSAIDSFCKDFANDVGNMLAGLGGFLTSGVLFGPMTVQAAELNSNGTAVFSIQMDNLSMISNDLINYGATISQFNENLNAISNAMSGSLRVYTFASMQKIKRALQIENNNCTKYGEKLAEIVETYRNFEGNICNNVNG